MSKRYQFFHVVLFFCLLLSLFIVQCKTLKVNLYPPLSDFGIQEGEAGSVVQRLPGMKEVEYQGCYLGQKPPGVFPEKFVPDFFTGGYLVHSAPMFSADGKEVFWSRFMMDSGQGVLMTARCLNGLWAEPIIIPISRGYDDRNPFLSYDGKRLYFHSNRNLGDESASIFRIWMTERKSGEWQKPVPLDASINSGKWNGGPSVTRDDILYYTSMHEESQGIFDIYRTEQSFDDPGRVERLGPEVNSEQADSYPFVADDESFLIFVSNRPGGFGGQDLYVSFRKQDGSWSSSLNMGSTINTDRDENFPIVSRDMRFLFFVRFYQQKENEFKTDVFWTDAGIIDDLRRGLD